VVVDLPEAIFSQKRLLFLAHTDVRRSGRAECHYREYRLDPQPDGGLRWNAVAKQIAFGASVQPRVKVVEMNCGCAMTRTNPPGLRTQICTMLKGAPDFNEQTTTNKIFGCPLPPSIPPAAIVGF